jgi:hypothetical protein
VKSFPGGHSGFVTHPRAFAKKLQEVLENAGNSSCWIARCFAPGSGKFTKGHLVLASGEYLRVSIYLPVNKTVEPKAAYF